MKSSWDYLKKPNDILWTALLTVLCILCFPVNPLILLGLLKTDYNQMTYISGWITWTFGMILVLSPIILFPRRGGVEKGKSFVHTTKLVDTGVYRIVRHPQYLGGIFAIFITTPLWYPHWLFVILGVFGIAVVYISCRAEDRYLLEKFGDEYRKYMHKVPGINMVSGIIRLVGKKGRPHE